MTLISPSLPAANFDEIKSLVEGLRGVAPLLQIDIVDGEFAPFLSWPFTAGIDVQQELQRLKELPTELKIEIDCMVRQPEQYLDTLVELGVSSVIVHMGSTTAYEDIIAHARQHNYQLGLALTSDVSLDNLTPFVERIDFVQVMGIKEVGRQGQPFDERTIDTLTALHESYPKLPLVVDGAVNETTALRLVSAGATRLAPGSAISKASDQCSAYQQLLTLTN
jgi:ribulose-phosphate 3-epimerase